MIKIFSTLIFCLLTLFCSSNPKHISFETESPKISNSLNSSKTSTPFPESKYFIFGNEKFLHFREFIPNKKINGNILLIHGFGGNTYSFRKNIQTLLELDYLVLAVDLPNFGYSMYLKNWNHSNEFRAELLWKFLQFYESQKNLTNKKWTILGHSMGGVVATYMAQMFPKKTEKLILISPALEHEPNFFLRGLAYLPFLESITKNWIEKTLRNREQVSKILQSAYGIEPFFPLEEDIEGYTKPLLLNNSFEYGFDLLKNSKNINPLSLKKILVPVFIFHGLNDKWVSVNSVIKQSSYFPNVKLFLYSNTGHCPMETYSEEFNKDIKNILH